MNHLETDYLIVGAGAAGLAFADTLIDEDPQAHVAIVDRHGKPGGHWNDAYAYVTLHQPSAFYGVNSMPLGSGQRDAVGLNRGLCELASGPEICAYYDRVMNRKLLPSGRVSYHPLSELRADGHIESLLSGAVTSVTVRRKRVDAAYMSPSVPSTHRPRFAIDPGVRLVPPNALPGLWQRGADERPRRFVIVGAGKTAMDAVVWLIQSGADPDTIQWVVPRDSWLMNRIMTQPGAEFFVEAMGGQAAQMEAFAQASSVDDLFQRLESCGMLMRIDPNRTPSMFHLATIAPGELEVLRRVRDVVRAGHVRRLSAGDMQLEHGTVPVAPDTLFVDCTASAVERRAMQPIFQDGRIVLQLLRLPQPAFSAALTAWVEVHADGDKERNRLCTTVPFPYTLAEYPRAMMASLWNQFQWGQDKALRGWIRDSRLDGFGRLLSGIAPDDTQKLAILARLKAASMPAMANLQKLAAA